MKRFFAVSVLIIAAATMAFGQCSDADKKKFEALDRAWGAAGQRGDQAFLKNVYAEDYMNLSPTELAYVLMTRSGRVSYEDLKRRDPAFIREYESALIRG